jgi:undecaprenyl-diphosphatase
LDLNQIILLAVVQGFTEFLPISSSAHLILVPWLTDWQDQGLAFDVAVHVGTLTAVIAYFHRELWQMGRDWTSSLRCRQHRGESRLAWAVLLGTIPVALGGLLCGDWIEIYLRSPWVIAITTLAFGLLLWCSDLSGVQQRDEHSLHWRDVTIIGLAQALALIPGTSRSGITMTAGLFVGLTREAAARFSFLLSIPVILLAGAYQALAVSQHPRPGEWGALLLGAVLSGISAWLCIHFFLKLLHRISFTPFVIYRLLLGVLILVLYIAPSGG